MKLIIHDLSIEKEKEVLKLDENTKIIRANNNIKKCIGCFGCWIKTPGTCVLKDNYRNMGREFNSCNTIIIY